MSQDSYAPWLHGVPITMQNGYKNYKQSKHDNKYLKEYYYYFPLIT
jgi:hypothetical protein